MSHLCVVLNAEFFQKELSLVLLYTLEQVHVLHKKDTKSLCPLHQSAYLCYFTPSNRMGSCQAHSVDLIRAQLNTCLYIPSDQAIDLCNANPLPVTDGDGPLGRKL